MAEQGISCVEPIAPDQEVPSGEQAAQQQEVVRMETARVGKKAPEFTAMAYYEGGFKRISLSDFAREWVMVCFYPGNFTFV